MDDVIVISFSDESEEEERIWRKRRKRKRPSRSSPSQDIIDLTVSSDVFAHVTSSDDNVIDLTACEDPSHGTLLQQMKSESSISSPSEGRGSDPESDMACSSVDSFYSKNLEFNNQSSESHFRSAISCLSSLQSITGFSQPDDCLPGRSEADFSSKRNIKHPYVMPLHLQDRHLEIGTQVQHVTSSTPALHTEMLKIPEETLCSPSITINKSLLYKLRHFKKPPIGHLISHALRPDKSLQVTPMPLSRLNIVNHTIDENFHQGTLYFLSEFVSASHYPPKEVISHLITSILLGAEEQAIRHEAYMILMKVQKLHPSTSESVAWEWSVLKEVMSKQEYQAHHLFLQYVVQTLDDDFHLCLQRRSLHKSLCKSMLSCDRSIYNVKDVIRWLIDAVKQMPETSQDAITQSNQQMAVFLLQRMLSIAVEVDNSPTMNSTKMAEYIFPFVASLETRQRELFFTSTENILLRAKILEVIFHHNCEPPTSLPLCFGKILHFIRHSTLQMDNQSLHLERCDEMLYHITLLCLSLQTVITDHLRTPIIDRPDEILKRVHSRLCQHEDITESEVDISLALFRKRTSSESETPTSLLNRIFVLRSLLHTAVKR